MSLTATGKIYESKFSAKGDGLSIYERMHSKYPPLLLQPEAGIILPIVWHHVYGYLYFKL